MTGIKAEDVGRLDLLKEAREVAEEIENLLKQPKLSVMPEGLAHQLYVLTRALMLNTRLIAHSIRNDKLESLLTDEMKENFKNLIRIEPRHNQYVKGLAETDTAATILHALHLNTILLMAMSSFDECRMTTPYAPMRTVITSDGRKMTCCLHNPEHCVE